MATKGLKAAASAVHKQLPHTLSNQANAIVDSWQSQVDTLSKSIKANRGTDKVDLLYDQIEQADLTGMKNLENLIRKAVVSGDPEAPLVAAKEYQYRLTPDFPIVDEVGTFSGYLPDLLGNYRKVGLADAPEGFDPAIALGALVTKQRVPRVVRAATSKKPINRREFFQASRELPRDFKVDRYHRLSDEEDRLEEAADLLWGSADPDDARAIDQIDDLLVNAIDDRLELAHNMAKPDLLTRINSCALRR